MKIIKLIILLSFILGQDFYKIQIVSKHEMNMNWLSPLLPDSSFFTYDSFNYAGFSNLATDCYDIEFDYSEPPPLIDDWCKITFPHFDNGPGECWENNLGLNQFTQDIRYQNEETLQHEFMEWDINFSANLPGFSSIYLVDYDIPFNCNINMELNSEIYNFGFNDTIQFWYTAFIHPPQNLILKIGECIIYGDVNQDNVLDVTDILIILNHILGNEMLVNNLEDADYNQDSFINVNDIVAIVYRILEI